MSNTNVPSVLDEKIALVSLTIRVPGCYRRLTPGQIAALGGSLPDSKAVTEGSLKVFDNDAFAPFLAIRRALFSALQKCGIKALGSSRVFAIPRAKLDKIMTQITSSEADFKSETASLDANYESIFEAHVTKNQEAETLICAKKFSRLDVISRLFFAHSVFSIQPVVREGEEAGSGLRSIVSGLGRQLFEEVSKEMVILAESDTFTKNGRGVQRTLRPIRAAIEKLEGLEFLDPATVAGAVKLFKAVLADMPVEGYIEGEAYQALYRLVVTIGADTDELVNAASKVANGIEVKEVLFPTPPAAIVTEPEVVIQSATEAPVAVAPAVAPPGVMPSLPNFGTGLPPLPSMQNIAPRIPAGMQLVALF
ncbi:MAG: DUF3150 domain-containing protein [Rhodocyclaceae bacterium]|nr:MAG: DUF3150 domain-containing protein [Rhodocyclaceae bacterium]